ncbi:hypothetical protein BDZ45DRAFT_439357 [Acephala macrosclerotiorum]|nr:hypothetical protein BDZ45DRAFT_439357 [Acephala macrosclerotiorum]
MFNGRFIEGQDHVAHFLEDDPEAWERLIHWCYKGELHFLRKPRVDTLRWKATHECWVWLRLCCLAEKYGMTLLQNLGVDSINSYLRHGDPRPRLKFDVFSMWSFAHMRIHTTSLSYVVSYLHTSTLDCSTRYLTKSV